MKCRRDSKRRGGRFGGRGEREQGGRDRNGNTWREEGRKRLEVGSERDAYLRLVS